MCQIGQFCKYALLNLLAITNPENLYIISYGSLLRKDGTSQNLN